MFGRPWLKSLYLVGKITKYINRPIIIKLNDIASKLLKLRNLKLWTMEKKQMLPSTIYRMISELEAFGILRKEVKLKQLIADQNNSNV